MNGRGLIKIQFSEHLFRNVFLGVFIKPYEMVACEDATGQHYNYTSTNYAGVFNSSSNNL